MKSPKSKKKVENLRVLCLSLSKNFEKRSHRKLRKIFSELIRELPIYYSKKRFAITLLAYVLSKIVSKPRLMGKEHVDARYQIIQSINRMADRIDTCSDDEFEGLFDDIKDKIKNLEKSDPRFLMNMINKGRLKIAAIMYAQGISLGRASELTGIDRHDILDYSGKTYMADRLKEEIPIFERINIAKKILYK